MALLSEKYGFKPVKSVLQVDGIDADLRVSLWNALTVNILSTPELSSDVPEENPSLYRLFLRLWLDYFKWPIDRMPDSIGTINNMIKELFFKCAWYEVYDLIQFVANTYSIQAKSERFIDSCNTYLEREVSGYRFVGSEIAPITSTEEINEIEQALESGGSISVHLKTALSLLSDRESPDYRNSIKESISAVEAMCRSIAGSKATLGKALTEIRRQGKVDLHNALEGAFNKLYGYTSDKEGIRHSILEESKLDSEDARFMLVSCSAFINYLKVKASKSEIKLEIDN